jgi:hypothetical protein
METPVFPVAYDSLPAKKTFFNVPKVFFINQNGEPARENQDAADAALFKIEVFTSSFRFHPEPGCLYYRISDCEDGSSLACVWDIEADLATPEARAEYDSLLHFIRGADLLIHDTMYTAEEYASTSAVVRGFGHSTYEMALETASKSGAKITAAFHYNPQHTDAFLDKLADQYKGRLILPQQGDVITLAMEI